MADADARVAARPGRAPCAADTARVRKRSRSRSVGLALGAFGFASICATTAAAQFSMIRDEPARFEWRGHVEADYRAEFETKSDGGDEWDAWRVGVAGDFGGPINESVLVSFGARYAHSSFDINLDNGPPAGFGGTRLPREPWNTLNVVDLLPTTTVLVGDRVAVLAAVPIRYAGESGAERNGFAAGVSALARWQVNDALAVGVGIGVTSQLEDEAETFPLVALNWRITESFRLVTEGDWFQGGQATLLWGPSEQVRLTFSGGYERVRFRLDEYGSAADTNGIGEITSIPIELGLRLTFMEQARFDFRVGLGIAGRLRVESDSGNKLYDQRFDPAPRVGIALSIPFGLPAR